MSEDLTAAERRAIHLWRQMGYGTMTVKVSNGEPKVCQVMTEVHLDKPQWDGVSDLLQRFALTEVTTKA